MYGCNPRIGFYQDEIVDEDIEQIIKDNKEKVDKYRDMSTEEWLESEILPLALDCNISLFQFWEYTLKEVKLIISSYQKRREEELKLKAYMEWNQAQQVVEGIATIMQGSKKFKARSLAQFYPSLFEDENKDNSKKEYTKEENKQINIEAQCEDLRNTFMMLGMKKANN